MFRITNMRIQMRVTYVSFLVCIFLAGCFLLYQISNLPSDVSYGESEKEKLNDLENRLYRMEKDLDAKHELLKETQNSVNDMMNNQGSLNKHASTENALNHPKHRLKGLENDIMKVDLAPPTFPTGEALIKKEDCSFSESSFSKTDIQMKNVYDTQPFDNPDGGVWKQGWNIEVDSKRWSATNKLKVFVVPHSHNDPGWIKTFEDYFNKKTNKILDLAITKLPEFPNMKFIWAEISFLSFWWDRKSANERRDMARLVQNGQLEIVSGGWVMPDEANSHYFSMLDQLFTGHEWVQANLNIKPKNTWAIDPFGLSPTMAYLHKIAGLQNMVIQRAHYSIKKYLAKIKSLEFRWRQIWDKGSSSDMFCHLMPFYSYDVPHTCGPDPKVCCQFDFRRIYNAKMSCPWKVPPRKITENNVAERAALLLDQYRKKAELFKTNVLLVPLGDDFRYEVEREWTDQFTNYETLFEHMNSDPDAHVEAQFGTLSDYFDALKKEVSTDPSLDSSDPDLAFPSLSGDFFSYSDRDDHYWTGYYTSRPFYKRFDRIFHSYLRSAEIFFSLMVEKLAQSGNRIAGAQASILSSMELLKEARHFHGLFQHHDGITGTSKDHVVIDYANKMLTGIENCQKVIQVAVYALLSKNEFALVADKKYFSLHQFFASYKSLLESVILHVDGSKAEEVYISNSEAQIREQIVTVKVSTPYVQVKHSMDKKIMCQVDPMFDFNGQVVTDTFEVHFLVKLPPLSVSRFTVEGIPPWAVDHKYTTYSRILHSPSVDVKVPSVFAKSVKKDELDMKFSFDHLSAYFTSQGLLRSFESFNAKVNSEIKFIKYDAGKGGAYLFMPVGKAREYKTKSVFLALEGFLKTSVSVFDKMIKHQVSLHNSPGADGIGLLITNTFDIRNSQQNTEYGMRFDSDVRSGDTFYTDLNGFQIIKRKYHSKIPLQGNFYPMASQMFIQDETKRLSILSAQPLGGASLASGQMEVIFDRQLNQDDDRGLGQGVFDNVLTQHSFYLLVEAASLDRSSQDLSSEFAAFPSLSSHVVLSHLLHPYMVLVSGDVDPHTLSTSWNIGGFLPCDVQLVNLRSVLDSNSGQVEVALTLHRVGFDCAFHPNGLECETTAGRVHLGDFLGNYFQDGVRHMTLTHLYDKGGLTKASSLDLNPMEIYSYKLLPTTRA